MDEQFYSDRREIIEEPIPPLNERPIELVYSNTHPYALANVRIYGHELNPADYEIHAHDGLIILKYHWNRVHVKVE